MKFRLHVPTTRLLSGLKGVELGAAAHNPFGVDAINVAPNIPTDDVIYNAEQLANCGEIAPIDLYGHAGAIPLPDNSQDFVLSSHVLEHAPDLLRAFLEMQRVVRNWGYIVAILPQPDALPEDRGRAHTPLADLWRAYREGWTWDSSPEGYPVCGRTGHYWRLSCAELVVLVGKLHYADKRHHWPGLNWKLVDREDPDSKVGNGYYLAWQVHKRCVS